MAYKVVLGSEGLRPSAPNKCMCRPVITGRAAEPGIRWLVLIRQTPAMVAEKKVFGTQYLDIFAFVGI